MEDSSVLFNLREIMQLENERIRAEQSAARAAVERAALARAVSERQARERLERERQVELEREQARTATAAAAERERTEALLRVRLDAEARERIERERLAQAHARELGARAAGDRRHARRWLLIALGAALLAGSGGYYARLPRLQAAQAREAALQRQTAEAAARADALRRELSALHARQRGTQGATTAAGSSVPVVATPTAAHASPLRPARPKPATGHRPPRNRATEGSADPLRDLDDPNDDPIEGVH